MPDFERRVVDRTALTPELEERIQTRIGELAADVEAIESITVSDETKPSLERIVKGIEKQIQRLEKQIE